jgi:hypothetical protein
MTPRGRLHLVHPVVPSWAALTGKVGAWSGCALSLSVFPDRDIDTIARLCGWCAAPPSFLTWELF